MATGLFENANVSIHQLSDIYLKNHNPTESILILLKNKGFEIL